MPTLDGDGPRGEPMVGQLATHHGGKAPLAERFRRAQLRAQMFGDPGETLTVGRYTVTGRIGNGAMGTVYRAVDPSLDREVAVKVLHRSDDLHRARTTIEAKALAKLSHPNVVTVHEVGTEDDQLFVAMELVAGQTLQAWLQDLGHTDVLDVFVQAAAGLQAAHDAGIVHRDFKPDNVIVGDDHRVRVLDFGMARTPGTALPQEDGSTADALPVEPALTRTGVLAGTPSYMAPEQFEGSRVDARADQFAFCIALHEALWGVRPFDGETVADLAARVLAGEAQLFQGSPRVGVPNHQLEAARAVITRGLRTDPRQRFDSMRALAEQLRGVPAKPEISSPWPVALRMALVAALIAAPLALVIGLTTASNGTATTEGPQQPPVVQAPTPPPQPDAPRCGLGTELRNGACVPIEWDPTHVQCIDGHCIVHRSLFVGADGQDAPLMRQGRFVPAMDAQGNAIGFKVFGVRRDTAAYRVGIRTGDVVEAINGIPVGLDSVESLNAEVRRAAQLKVALQRAGEVHVIELDVQD